MNRRSESPGLAVDSTTDKSVAVASGLEMLQSTADSWEGKTWVSWSQDPRTFQVSFVRRPGAPPSSILLKSQTRAPISGQNLPGSAVKLSSPCPLIHSSTDMSKS